MKSIERAKKKMFMNFFERRQNRSLMKKKNEIQTRMINLCVKIFNHNLLYQKLVIIVFDKLNNVYYISTQCSLFFLYTYIVMHLFIMSCGLLLFFPSIANHFLLRSKYFNLYKINV